MAPKKRKAPPPAVYHEYYNSPEDTVFIRSKDGIYLKADKDRLIRSSTFFSDLLDSSTPISSTNDETHPIDLDYKALTIASYLDVISVSGNLLFEIEYTTCKEVYELSKFTMSEKAVDFTRKMLPTSAKRKITDKPWDLLLFASTHNDVPLAKSSFTLLNSNGVAQIINRHIIAFDGYYLDRDQDQFSTWMRQLRPSWQLALYHAVIQGGQVRRTDNDTYRGGFLVSEDWRGLGTSFNPAEFES